MVGPEIRTFYLLDLPNKEPTQLPSYTLMSKHLVLNTYSTLGGKTDKLDEAVNRELNVTRS